MSKKIYWSGIKSKTAQYAPSGRSAVSIYNEYKSIISEVKNKFKSIYVGIQAHIANAAIKKHVGSFNAFVELMNKIIDQEYDWQVNMSSKT